MIRSFADTEPEQIYDGLRTKKARRRLPLELWEIAQDKLDIIDAATEVKDLRSPPANRLKKLRGELAGSLSIRINDQYRIVFMFKNGDALNVKITDYH